MAFPSKDYDRVIGLQKKWGMSQEDMFYAIENGILKTCIWLPLRYVERVVVKGRKFIYENHEHQEGFVGVRIEDCRRICSTGCAKLRIFNSVTHESHILRLAYEPPQPDIAVRINDMVVLQKDRNQFEKEYNITEKNVVAAHEDKPSFSFIASEDYRYVKLDGQEFHLGDIQARIIGLLHSAAQSHGPWVHGKTLIYEAGSQAVRIRDLFKNKNYWRRLIVSNERGYYRLNIPMEGLEPTTQKNQLDTSQLHLAV